MELEREPHSQPTTEATGSIGEKKKMQVITAAAIGFGLLVAMLLGWAWTIIHRPSQRPRTVGPTPAASKAPAITKREFDEGLEKAYEQGRLARDRNNTSGGNANTSGSSGTSAGSTQAVAEHKRTAKDDYDDLLAKAAVAGSAVESTKGVSSSISEALGNLHPNLPSVAASPAPEQHSKTAATLQPIGPNTLPAFTFIECSLVNALDGDNVGPVKLQVSNDVYYPFTFDIAIPQGAVFLGEAQRVSGQFQQRLAVAFDRLQLRRGGKLYEIKLDRVPGLDQQGATALKDKVNNHYGTTFGAALAIGAIGGLAQIGNGSYGGLQGYDSSTQIRNGITQTMAENASRVLDHFLMRPPTITIRPGTPAIVCLLFGVDLS